MICPNRTHNHNERKKIRERANERGRERVKKERAAWGIEREKKERKKRERTAPRPCVEESSPRNAPTRCKGISPHPVADSDSINTSTKREGAMHESAMAQYPMTAAQPSTQRSSVCGCAAATAAGGNVGLAIAEQAPIVRQTIIVVKRPVRVATGAEPLAATSP